MNTFFQKLAGRCDAIGSSLCIGIDPDPDRLPTHLGQGIEATRRFCIEIVEATAPFAAAFKPNLAFFESLGIEGFAVLADVMGHVPDGVPIILDAKRGDIGSTGRHYARALFERLGADAVTVNPYMGRDAVEPFLGYPGKGVYLLCLTSNPGAGDFQLKNDLFIRVAIKAGEWNSGGEIGLVVGATQPMHLTSVYTVAPSLPLLLPGVGAQGGAPDQILGALPPLPRHHLLFNVSRAIIYASSDENFASAAARAAEAQRNSIEAAANRSHV